MKRKSAAPKCSADERKTIEDAPSSFPPSTGERKTVEDPHTAALALALASLQRKIFEDTQNDPDALEADADELKDFQTALSTLGSNERKGFKRPRATLPIPVARSANKGKGTTDGQTAVPILTSSLPVTLPRRQRRNSDVKACPIPVAHSAGKRDSLSRAEAGAAAPRSKTAIKNHRRHLARKARNEAKRAQVDANRKLRKKTKDEFFKKRIHPDLSVVSVSGELDKAHHVRFCEEVTDLDGFLPSESYGNDATVILCKESANYMKKFNLYCGAVSRGFKLYVLKDDIFVGLKSKAKAKKLETEGMKTEKEE